ELLVEGAAGVFAGGALDPATAMLLEALELAPDASALDLGCGAGIIGMVAARLAPRGAATLVDSNTLAVALAGRNLAANGIANARALASDGIAAVRGERFDAVLTNPPFHQGRVQSDAVARRFISEAREALAPGGALWMVANRFLRYEPALAEHFAAVREVAGDSRFKVLRASL
ncbi:MAG TPA: class I SAM-dependent methyltransferase, partial [Herpetosiphonaceae bacterium]